MKNFVQEGVMIDHVAVAAISSGDPVVIGNIVGVAAGDAAIGETVPVRTTGVVNLPKLDAAVIALYEQVAFDASGGVVDDSSISAAAGDVTLMGVALEAKGATTGETIKVRLREGGGILN